jgi:hypothetical protein
MSGEEVMTEHNVRKRQIKKAWGAEGSMQHLANLHHHDEKLRSSTGMDVLKKIAADSVLRLEKMSRVVTRFRKTAQTEAKTDDPPATHVQGMLTHANKTFGNALPASHGRGTGGLRLLDVDHFIQEVVQALRRIVKKRVRLQAILADRDMRVMADREKMNQVFATIVAYGSEIIRKGGTITILARLLPIKNDLLEEGTGRCALLSVSSTDVAADLPGSGPGRKGRAGKSMRRAFSAIRSVIGGHNGSARVSNQQGKTQFNIYLPVLQGT